MTAPSPGELAVALEQTIRSTPAVTALYPPGSWWSTVARRAGAQLGVADDPPVTVRRLPDGTVEVCAAIATGDRAADTCRAVHDAVVDHLHRLGQDGATVRITVDQVTS